MVTEASVTNFGRSAGSAVYGKRRERMRTYVRTQKNQNCCCSTERSKYTAKL